MLSPHISPGEQLVERVVALAVARFHKRLGPLVNGNEICMFRRGHAPRRKPTAKSFQLPHHLEHLDHFEGVIFATTAVW